MQHLQIAGSLLTSSVQICLHSVSDCCFVRVCVLYVFVPPYARIMTSVLSAIRNAAIITRWSNMVGGD